MNTVTLNMRIFHVVYRVNQAEYGIRILVDASQEDVNTYSTCMLIIIYTSSAPEGRRAGDRVELCAR